MSDLQVIYDPALQIGAIVDLDTNLGFGPICPGPDGGNLLQAFVDGMPFDVGILTAEQARDIFLSVFREDAQKSIEAQGQTDTGTVVTPDGATANAEALAAREAMETAGAPPEPAPADADMEADQSQTDQVNTGPTVPGIASDTSQVGSPVPVVTPSMTNCLVCNASGAGSSNPACVVCGGTGKVPVT